MNIHLKNFRHTHNLIVCTSGLFLLQNFSKIPLEGKIPLIEIDIPPKEVSLVILACLSLYFVVRLCIDWFQLSVDHRKKVVSKIDFCVGFVLSIIPIFFILNNYPKLSYIREFPFVLSILLLGIGEFIAGTTHVQIGNLKFIRSKMEANTKGLPRIPVMVRSCFVFTLINIVLLSGLTVIARLFFEEPLSSKWIYFILFPLFIHIPISIIEYFKMSPKLYKHFKKAIDEHDAAYQLGGWDKRAKCTHTELYKAANDGNYKKVKGLLEKGGNPNENGALGWSPFLISAANQHESIVNLFIEYGANVNQKNTLGRTALMFASNYGNLNILKTLLKNKALIDEDDNSNGGTALITASRRDQLEIVKELLKHGANVSLKDQDGKTALNYAQVNGNGELAKILRKNMS